MEEFKKCKKFGKEINTDTNMCLYCGEQQDDVQDTNATCEVFKKREKKLNILIAFLIVIIIISLNMLVISGFVKSRDRARKDCAVANSKIHSIELNQDSLNSDVEHKKEEIFKMQSELETIQKEKADLSSQYNQLMSDTENWRKMKENEQTAALAKAETDKNNAEAEQLNSEKNLFEANKNLSAAKIESQRRIEEGTTVYEDNYVKINYLKVEQSTNPVYGNKIVFLVENKTDVVLTIQNDAISLDGMDQGYLLMSDEVAPQSKGYVYASSTGYMSTNSPTSISGQLIIIDFSRTFLAKSYEATFVNVVVG